MVEVSKRYLCTLSDTIISTVTWGTLFELPTPHSHVSTCFFYICPRKWKSLVWEFEFKKNRHLYWNSLSMLVHYLAKLWKPQQEKPYWMRSIRCGVGWDSLQHGPSPCVLSPSYDGMGSLYIKKTKQATGSCCHVCPHSGAQDSSETVSQKKSQCPVIHFLSQYSIPATLFRVPG